MQSVSSLVFIGILAGYLTTCDSLLFRPKEKLVFVHTIWRHGDRTPVEGVLASQFKESDWPLGYGELTAKGLEQQFVLGRKLRKRYILDLSLVNKSYNPQEVYIQSSDVHRTLDSAQANLAGFYNSKGRQLPPPWTKWPQGLSPIPIHTLPQELDVLSVSVQSVCPRLTEMRKDFPKMYVVKMLTWRYRDVLKSMKQILGFEPNIFHSILLYNTINIEKARLRRLPDYASEKFYKALEELYEPAYELYNCEGGLDPWFADEMRKIVGGPILWAILDKMLDKIQCLENNSTNRDCHTLNALKYAAFSGHDLNLSSLSSVLGRHTARLTNEKEALVSLATALSFELWLQSGKTNTYNIKILLWDPKKSSFSYITRETSACSSDSCPVKTFANAYRRYRPILPIQQLCAQPWRIPTVIHVQ